MKRTLVIAVVLTAVFVASCEVQSGITKRSVEKYTTPTPTPDVTPTPEEPVDPKDIIQVDTSVVGPTLTVNESRTRTSLNCDKYNRVQVNVDRQRVSIRGGCMQLMVNGDGNEIDIDATMEIVLNGHENIVRYSKFANGHRPRVTDNGQGNRFEKALPPGPSRSDAK